MRGLRIKKTGRMVIRPVFFRLKGLCECVAQVDVGSVWAQVIVGVGWFKGRFLH